MSTGNDNALSLVVTGLKASVGGTEILHGIDLEVRPGQVVAIMGPNGSGKSTLSHVLMGRSGYTVTEGSARIGDTSFLEMPVWERARLGLFVAHQYPVEVPGVPMEKALEIAAGFQAGATDDAGGPIGDWKERLSREVKNVGFEPAMLSRAMNADLSGGEKKRNETLQITMLRPKIAVLDEIDSGLDVDGLKVVAKRLERATDEWGLGVLAITHYNRLLTELHADIIHVMVSGRIVATGGPEMATQLEATGYAQYIGEPTPA